MNDQAETSRTELPETRPEATEGAEAERSAFAVHRDPSLTAAGADPGSRVGRGITWVRPALSAPWHPSYCCWFESF